MEGYLNLIKISNFTSATTIKLIWVVLDKQTITYYESLDLKEQLPKNLLKVISLKDAKINKTKTKNHSHCITINYYSNNHMKTKTKIFDCKDATVCSLWFSAINRAIKLNEELTNLKNLPITYKTILELDLTLKLTKHEISKAYKKLCLKEHPDKG